MWLLQRRLDPVDPELIRRIEVTTDEATLQAWFAPAITATPDEVRQQILGSCPSATRFGVLGLVAWRDRRQQLADQVLAGHALGLGLEVGADTVP